MRSVILIGFMGSGKSTAARSAAAALEAEPIDVDALLQRDFGQPIERVFAERTAASVANSFAIDVSVVEGRPLSLRCPARQTSPRDASVSTTMSAIIACTSWKLAIGRPNCSRSFA